ncbi:hypothetical protein [Pleionea sp. CnH1-48]|uniref:hypothetical protein n=1 Tax=Pleionea sp. CnH1-48 TaxID=2954494 RepID=UPI002096B4E6|nr:hypothetical protein [Pleionea sp. CnH1-48]MCO7225372.1 hypothetical protein [Pleionea sp. CnH1-48]
MSKVDSAMTNFLAVPAYLTLLLLGSTLTTPAHSTNKEKRVAIDSSLNYKRCFLLQKHQQLTVSFKTSDPINFRITYNDKQGMNTLLSMPLLNEIKPTPFTLPMTTTYCLHWHNPQAFKIHLRYHLKSHKMQPSST